ncbi:sensor histidine kinase [Methylobacterium sp. WSM2598]|uniref:sensor histidine kinase n=1 Tax=Methylobacterium sp. WSM2598 TaxID=398261 RepID=UPI0003725B20|nr:ATP-binding protein [Methylobacterium sp. WSM2598]
MLDPETPACTTAPPRPVARGPLISLLLATTIPIVLFGAGAAYLAATQTRAGVRRAAAETVTQVAERVTSAVGEELAVLTTLALSPALDAPNLAAFYDEAQRITRARPLWETVSLVGADGRQILNLLRPLGSALGPAADLPTIEAVRRTRAPAIGGVGPVGPISGKRLVSVCAPVARDQALRDVLCVGLSPEGIRAILAQAGAPAGWIGTIVDREGRLIARSVPGDERVGRPPDAAMREAVARAPQGLYRSEAQDGVEVDTVYQTLAGTGGWSVHFAIPSDALDQPVARSLILLVAGLAAALALAAGLAVRTGREIAERRRGEQLRAALALATSEERAAVAIAAAELGTWRWDRGGGRIVGSARTRDLLGLPATAAAPDAFGWPDRAVLAVVAPEDRDRLVAAVEEALRRGAGLDIEFRVTPAGQQARWRRLMGREERPDLPRAGGGRGEGAVLHGVIADIEPRKRAEAAHHDLLRRLAQAQEDEQRRIARELHDQVGQTVTGLSLGLKGLEDLLARGPSPPRARDQVRWLQGLAGEIGRDIHRTASDLRPSALDDLGLVNALAALGADWTARYGLGVDVQAFGLSARLPLEVETAMYRVAQEALTNVLKHARATHVSVVLERRGERLGVVIEDDGTGFDPEACAPPAEGRPRRLGLSSIRERLSLIGGTLRVESAPGSGTTLFIDVPLAPMPEARWPRSA